MDEIKDNRQLEQVLDVVFDSSKLIGFATDFDYALLR